MKRATGGEREFPVDLASEKDVLELQKVATTPPTKTAKLPPKGSTTSSDDDAVAAAEKSTNNTSNKGKSKPPQHPAAAGSVGEKSSATTPAAKTPSRAPMTISPAPFKRSASAKALAVATAQVYSATPDLKRSSSAVGGIGSTSTSTTLSTTGGVGGQIQSSVLTNVADVKERLQLQLPGDGSKGMGTTTSSSSIANNSNNNCTPTHSPVARRHSHLSQNKQLSSGGEASLPGPPPMASGSKKKMSASQPSHEKNVQGQSSYDQTIELDPDPLVLKFLQEARLNKMLSQPRRPDRCPLFCVFYSEFDIIVGPKLCYQSPENFMEADIGSDVTVIHDILAREFDSIFPAEVVKKEEESGSMKGIDLGVAKRAWEKTVESNEPAASTVKEEEYSGDGKSDENSRFPNLNMPRLHSVEPTKNTPHAPTRTNDNEIPPKNYEVAKGNPPMSLKRPVNSSSRTMASLLPTTSMNPQQQSADSGANRISAGLSIFDSTSEYIITGSDLSDKMICLSSHNFHILSRPTIIKDTKYERNSLLFSFGFVLRRVEDPRPFRLLLSKLASTFRDMEVESRFLTGEQTRPRLRRILQGILVSLNGRKSECNLLLDNANVLNLKLYRPPREPAPPVPDHAVPVLLRPEWQMQAYDWDLTINWLIPHIDGLKNARLIAQSSEVDMEMVRACLRVLRHHGVLALVDVFRYENIYECTPLASSMLSGEQNALLDAAFVFVLKHNSSHIRCDASSGGSRASTPAFLEHHQHGSISSPGTTDNPNAPSDRIPGLADVRFDPGNLIQPIHHSEMPLLSSRQILPPAMPSSFPPVSAEVGNVASAIDTNVARNALSDSPIRQLAASHASSRLSLASDVVHDGVVSLPGKKNEKKLKAALAQLYASCLRDKTFGSILIEKVINGSKVDRGVGSRRGSERTISSDTHEGDEYGRPPESEYRFSSSSRERPGNRSPGRQRHQNGDVACLDVDWSEAFEKLDHRRFITFGVIHGLIRRIHEYPLAFDIPDEEKENNNEEEESDSESLVDDRSSHSGHRMKTDSYRHDAPTADRHKAYISPTLQSIPFPSSKPSPLASALNAKISMTPLSLGRSAVPETADKSAPVGHKSGASRRSTNRDQTRRLALCVAEAMDGSRCDDELCCTYQKSMKELLELIQKANKKAVIIKSVLE